MADRAKQDIRAMAISITRDAADMAVIAHHLSNMADDESRSADAVQTACHMLVKLDAMQQMQQTLSAEVERTRDRVLRWGRPVTYRQETDE